MGCSYQLSVSKKEMYVEVPKRYSTINWTEGGNVKALPLDQVNQGVTQSN